MRPGSVPALIEQFQAGISPVTTPRAVENNDAKAVTPSVSSPSTQSVLDHTASVTLDSNMNTRTDVRFGQSGTVVVGAVKDLRREPDSVKVVDAADGYISVSDLPEATGWQGTGTSIGRAGIPPPAESTDDESSVQSSQFLAGAGVGGAAGRGHGRRSGFVPFEGIRESTARERRRSARGRGRGAAGSRGRSASRHQENPWQEPVVRSFGSWCRPRLRHHDWEDTPPGFRDEEYERRRDLDDGRVGQGSSFRVSEGLMFGS